MRISDWSSDVCSSDLDVRLLPGWVVHHIVGKVCGRLANNGLVGATSWPAIVASRRRIRWFLLRQRCFSPQRLCRGILGGAFHRRLMCPQRGDAIMLRAAQGRLHHDTRKHHRADPYAGPGRVAEPPGEYFDRTAHQQTGPGRSEEHTSELQSLMRISYAVFCLKNKTH